MGFGKSNHESNYYQNYYQIMSVWEESTHRPADEQFLWAVLPAVPAGAVQEDVRSALEVCFMPGRAFGFECCIALQCAVLCCMFLVMYVSCVVSHVVSCVPLLAAYIASASVWNCLFATPVCASSNEFARAISHLSFRSRNGFVR